jgi:predicted enzyme related to lactoylglutathione lyase
MSDTHGTVFWTELMTRDVEAAKAYYSATCGWAWETMPMGEAGDYHLAMLKGKPVAGMMDMSTTSDSDDAPFWLSYFAVDDVDAAAAATEKAGGRIVQAPWDIPGTGRVAVLEDPTGAPMGLMTPEPMG